MSFIMYNKDVTDICHKLKGGVNMPGRNGTGPMGYGPLTGRGLGPCGGKMAHRGNFYGRRMGGGFGRNFGGAGYYSPANLTAEEQKELLGERKAYLESELNDLQKQLDEL
jgi:hypothetical protein